MGVPHNAISIALLEQFTGRQLGFFEWMAVGVPVFLALLVAFYVTLWLLVRPEIRDIPSGEAFLRAEQVKLGPLRSNERRVLWVFGVMICCSFCRRLPRSRLENSRLFQYGNPGASDMGEYARCHVSVVRDSIIGGRRLASALLEGRGTARTVELDVSGWWGSRDDRCAHPVRLCRVHRRNDKEPGDQSRGSAVHLAASVVAVSTNFISGTALYCSVFIPAAAQIGTTPASMAILIGNLAVGLIFPWAGATAATAFAAGEIGIERMIKIGIISTVIFIVVVATIHVMLARFV